MGTIRSSIHTVLYHISMLLYSSQAGHRIQECLMLCGCTAGVGQMDSGTQHGLSKWNLVIYSLSLARCLLFRLVCSLLSTDYKLCSMKCYEVCPP